MIDKYYTPDIEEFHIGFEYLLEEEFLDEDGCAYYEERQKVFSVDDTITFNRCVRVNDYPLYHISVKYLDKEDIESLGFEQQSLQYQYKKDWYRLISRCEENQYIIEDGRYQDQIFVGTIKNKSELKRLLKQLNIQ